jgi:hypothetical protein
VVVQIGKDFSLSSERPQGVPDGIHFISEYMSDIAAIILSMDSYPTGEDLLDVEWRTLICNLKKDKNEPDEEEFRNAYMRQGHGTESWLRHLTRMLLHLLTFGRYSGGLSHLSPV